GACSATARGGRAGIQRAVSAPAPATSCQVISIQLRLGSGIGVPLSGGMLSCRVADGKVQSMRLVKTCRAVLTRLAGRAVGAGAAAAPASAQALDKVSFGTNWVAE